MFSGGHAAQVRSQKGRCSAYKHPDHPLRKVNPQKDSLTASSDGTLAGMMDASSHRLNYTVLHFSSLMVLPCIKAVHSLILS